MTESERPENDHVDRLRAQWARELPALDTSAMSLLGRINRIANLVHPSISETFAGYGLDRGEFDVLATLRRAGDPYRLTPTELYKSLMITSGGLTARLNRLQKAGLIVREASREDRRSLAVRLTGEGVRKVEAAFEEDMGKERLLLDALNAGEKALLEELLRKLTSSLETP
ncbi:MarR family transcriptional regulator [uncultured Nitratireductor sp.]|uniref:MarR family winged helix-turn-helix transcriptional regulator n=1 Tax=uncultured Nitratireductor sp. TaxID=520953 RepID=UPI0025D43076|nr:MarR family transcriptional regulator [uncultured Nitratireductor sp.]